VVQHFKRLENLRWQNGNLQYAISDNRISLNVSGPRQGEARAHSNKKTEGGVIAETFSGTFRAKFFNPNER
jgi:hypothetical protein